MWGGMSAYNVFLKGRKGKTMDIYVYERIDSLNAMWGGVSAYNVFLKARKDGVESVVGANPAKWKLGSPQTTIIV